MSVGVVDVGTSVGFAHDGNDCYSRSSSDGLGFEEGEELVSMGDGYGL